MLAGSKKRQAVWPAAPGGGPARFDIGLAKSFAVFYLPDLAGAEVLVSPSTEWLPLERT
jgi:hypothetical protein